MSKLALDGACTRANEARRRPADNQTMEVDSETSVLRIEKMRSHASLTLSNGRTVFGCFFVAGASLRSAGPERVLDVLNDEKGFFPFEVHGRGPVRTVLVNRAHVVIIILASPEARRDPGYHLATERPISLLLTNGRCLDGAVRVYRPEGRDRLSDWARHPDQFRYVEAGDATVIVNVAHVLELSEGHE